MSEYGTISLCPRDDVIAGSRVTLTFAYTVGSLGVKAGGSLRIRTPNDGWGAPMAHRKQLPKRIEGRPFSMDDVTYCTHNRCNLRASLQGCSPDVRIELEAECGVGPLSQFIVARVCGGDLAQGDVVTVVYGDRTWGEDGVAVQKVAPTPDRFVAHVDVAGTGAYHPLDDCDLELKVRPGPVSQFNVVVPAVVKPDRAFEIKLAGTDAFRNRPDTRWEGEVRISCTNPDIALPGAAAFSREDDNYIAVKGVRARSEGIYHVTVDPAEGGWRRVSNPVWCTERDLHIFFGDLHCHGIYHGDGRSIGTPEDLYAYGRDVAGLDFMAVTDGGGWRSPGWEETQEVTNRYDAPGRFVAFKGFEYGGDGGGHRNVIYRDCVVEPALDFPGGFYAYYRGRDDVISIPHHTKVRTDWDYYDADLEALVEVYSCWGSGMAHADPLWNKSEKEGSGVYNALKRGYRMGFIGSGDSHSGMPGRSFPQDRQWFMHQKSGFACVYASALTREAIFEGLRSRRCYATTGVRAILEFSVDGCSMGGALKVRDPEAPRAVRAHAIGTDRLKLLRVIKNNETLVRRELGREEEFFEYYDTAPARQGDFYYVRIVQEDENTIWSSPVWVDLEG